MLEMTSYNEVEKSFNDIFDVQSRIHTNSLEYFIIYVIYIYCMITHISNFGHLYNNI